MKNQKPATNEEYPFLRLCCKTAHKTAPDLGRYGARIWEDPKLKEAIELLELGIRPEELHALSLLSAITALAAALLILLASLLANFPVTFLFIFFIILPPIIYLYIEKYPLLLLESKKTEVMGHVPAIASYLVISLRINPILEKAVEFAAEHTTGFPKKLLRRMVSDINMGNSSSIVESLSAFADEWGDMPEFKSFTQLLIASTLETSEKGRWLMLDNGMNVLLNGLKERCENSARGLETPILIVFTFFVILPLVFIGLVPIIPTIGLEVPPFMIFLLYDLVLPIILFVAISLVVSSKPLTVPPVEIPEVECSKLFNLNTAGNIERYGFFTAIAAISLVIAMPGLLDLMAALKNLPPAYPLGTSFILLGLSFGAGICLLATSYSVKKMRDEIKCEEEEFIETLRQLSVLLSSGRPLPSAMAHLKGMNKGKTASIFSKAANNIKLFNIDMRQAFFNEKCGSASRIYSEMIHGAIDTIVAMADKSSKSIASVIIRLSEHMRNMRTVDVEMKKIIGNITSSMVIIAVFVGPLVGGVATSLGYLLAETLGEGDMNAMGIGSMMAETMNPEIIKLIIGLYVLETTIILSIFADELVYGNDAVIRKYHLGIYLPLAAIIFTSTVFLVQGVLSSMM
ncbi:MAG: type II secretion system F family protein [Candidatus Altiarchaeota archaeon]|nr:type II secretion system F family protein [Candidatus Altiarchaeota archaeon]